MEPNLLSARKLIGTALQAAALLYFIAVLMINVFPFLGGHFELLDFGSFYASGLSLSRGENPYSPDSEYVLTIDFPLVGAGGNMVNLNPPISAMLFASISGVDPYRSFRIWQLLSALLFVGVIFGLTAVYQANMTPARFIWPFTIAAFWQTLTLGQIYALLFLFVSLGWILVKRERYLLGGIFIGVVVALKPNFLIWPLFLLFAGYWLVFLAALATSLLISLVPVIFYGLEIYRQWLDASALQQGTLVLPGNSSLIGLGARLEQIPAGIALSALLVIALFYWSTRTRSRDNGPSEYVSSQGLLASILASPVAWAGYTMLLLPIFFSRKHWNGLVLLSAALLTFPFGILLKLWQDSYANFVIFGWFYGWAILSLLAGVVKNTMITSSIQTNWSTSSKKL